VLVEARDLYRFYHAGDEEVGALRGVSLDVEHGEFVAVTGPSGSGKSTLLACVAGLDDPDGGIVRIDGERMSRRPETERARLRARRVGLLFQTNNLVEHLTLRANVQMTRRLARLHVDDGVDDLVRRLGLEERAHAYPSQLSGGEAVRAGLAVALATGAALVLADEPTGELDRASGDRALRLLREHADSGGAVVVVTHNAYVASAADRVLRLVDGRMAS
jgi:putative ABC transport system ATP-binding protein